MGKTDDLDRKLFHLPSDAPAADLAGRVFRYVQVKRRRKLFLRLGLNFVLAGSGLWLVSPVFTALPTSANLSDPALSVLLEWVRVAFAGIDTCVNYVWNGFTGLQSNIVEPISASVWLGVAVLTLSVLLALGQLLPHSANPLNKGVNA
jgi:hypothetical protein